MCNKHHFIAKSDQSGQKQNPPITTTWNQPRRPINLGPQFLR